MNPSNRSHRGVATRRSNRLAWLATIAVAASATFAHAMTWNDVRVQYNGFASQGYIFTHGNNQFGDTKGSGSFDFREVVGNASVTVGPKLRAGAQVFAEKLGKYGHDKLAIDWALVDYNVSQQFGLRAGRVKLPRGLYNEALDLDSTRPFVLLPPSLYDARLRDFQAAINGGMAYGSVDTRLGNFEYKAFYGGTHIPKGSGVQDMLTRADIVEHIGVDSLYGATLFWSGPINGLRAGLSFLRQQNFNFLGWNFSTRTQAYTRRESDEFSNNNYIGSVEYTRGDWTFASEWQAQQTFDLSTGRRLPANLFYISAARRLGQRWEVGTYFSGTRKSRGLSATTSSSSHRLDEYAASVKFSPIERLSFKLEAHAIDGTASVFDVDGSPNPRANRKEEWYLFAAKTTLTF